MDDKAGTKDVSVEELALEVRELRSGAAKAEMQVQEVRALSRGISKKLRKIKHDKMRSDWMRYIRPGGKRFYTTLKDLRKQLAVLDSQKEELEAQNAVLQREIKNLQSRGSTSAEQNGMDTNSVMDHGHTQLFDLNNGAENFHRQLTINVKAKEETT